MWQRLTLQYEQNAAENIFVLIDCYYQYTHVEGDNMMTHVSRIEGMVAQLADLGSPIDDNQVVSKVLMALPPQYANFCESWEPRPTIMKTKANLIAKLILSESMMEHRSTSQKGKDLALVTRSQERSAPKRFKSHIETNSSSPIESRFKNTVENKPSDLFCTHCGLTNHNRPDCHGLKRRNEADAKGLRRPRCRCTSQFHFPINLLAKYFLPIALLSQQT